MKLFRNESSNPKWNAQHNLEGITHYVDDDTLRCFKARILNTVITDNGLLFALVESYSSDFQNTKRLFRPVIFDITGNVLFRPGTEDGFKTSKQAINAMWDELNRIDAIAVTHEAINRQEKNYQREITDMRESLSKLIDKAA